MWIYFSVKKLKDITEKKPKDELIRNLVKKDFTDFPTANLTLNRANHCGENVGCADVFGFVLLGTYEIPRGVSLALGQRKNEQGQGGNVLYIRMDASGGRIEGRYKITLSDPTKQHMQNVGEFGSAEMYDTTKYDRRNNPVPNLRTPWCLERGYLMLSFRPDTDNDILVYDDANNEINIPVTLKSGEYRRKTIELQGRFNFP